MGMFHSIHIFIAQRGYISIPVLSTSASLSS